MWPRQSWWKPAYADTSSLTEALKHLYVSKDSPEMAKPAYAVLAYERHWITGSAFKRIARVATGRIIRGIASLMAEPSPLFAMLKRQA